MYSGRITEVGTVTETGPRLVIEAPKTAAGLSAGGSVNVNGSRLSAVLVDEHTGRFGVEISAETAPRPSAALPTRTPPRPTSCGPVMSFRWPGAPAA